MKIPILTYHSLNTRGTSYSDNDHVALESDLRLLKRLGYRVVPLSELVDAFNRNDLSRYEGSRVCAITFDDGVTHDYIDFYRPKRGLLKSFARLLREAEESERAGWERLTATSFVIASPDARDILDRTCIAGRGQWHDLWWRDAAEEGVLEIGNHSWDHCHANLPEVAQREQRKGNFFVIDNQEDAERQILDAEEYIESRLGKLNVRIFAYPYGHVNAFIRDEFFPRHADRFRAAFSTAGDYMTERSNRWSIPRFVCGEHWSSPEGLEAILLGGGGARSFLRRKVAQMKAWYQRRATRRH